MISKTHPSGLIFCAGLNRPDQERDRSRDVHAVTSTARNAVAVSNLSMVPVTLSPPLGDSGQIGERESQIGRLYGAYMARR